MTGYTAMSSHASTNQVPCCCLQDRIHGSGDGPVRSGSEDDEREDGQEDEDGSGFEGSGLCYAYLEKFNNKSMIDFVH